VWILRVAGFSARVEVRRLAPSCTNLALLDLPRCCRRPRPAAEDLGERAKVVRGGREHDSQVWFYDPRHETEWIDRADVRTDATPA
jgi:hypothetical protein